MMVTKLLLRLCRRGGVGGACSTGSLHAAALMRQQRGMSIRPVIGLYQNQNIKTFWARFRDTLQGKQADEDGASVRNGTEQRVQAFQKLYLAVLGMHHVHEARQQVTETERRRLQLEQEYEQVGVVLCGVCCVLCVVYCVLCCVLCVVLCACMVQTPGPPHDSVFVLGAAAKGSFGCQRRREGQAQRVAAKCAAD